MMAQSYSSLPALVDRQFVAWQQLIEARTGLDFSLHRSILQSGLHRALRNAGQFDCDAYFDEIQHQADASPAWQALIECIAIKETSFLRQPEAFELVRHYLYQRVPAVASLDLWSVGCATGEEAYGLAMAANDAIETLGSPTRAANCCFGVIGSDICPDALRQARTGRFARRRVERLPDIVRRRYFVTDESFATTAGNAEYMQVVESLRQRVCFMQANLLQVEQLPVLPMDVIFCQNVLVYFRRWRTRHVLDALVQRLKPGGLLVLGPGEAAHWQHPALVRQLHGGVTAWLRRPAGEDV
jgi:chemotaxis protein methyltransferase CheR/type IV pilus assembly protein PilK